MTGNCESPRAKELMDKACLVETEYGYTPLKDGMDIVAYTGKTWNIPYRRYLHFSALELYIQMPDCNTPRIINYMQGKTQRLYI
jgi:hypothetical protein